MNLKYLPSNPVGTVTLGAVAAISITPGTRAQLPAPPGNVKVNGQAWPNGASLGAVDATLTWNHRLRALGTAITQQDAGNTAGGPEGSYTVEVLIAGVVIHTTPGVVGTSFVYTYAQRVADDANLTKTVQFRIKPVNGALVGTARLTDAFRMA